MSEHSAEEDAWPCDDYRAPLTCWTSPSGRKQIICQGCREAFVFGPDVQVLYRRALARAWDEGFKQGGPMHDVNYDDPDAHTRNPYVFLSEGGSNA